MNLFRVLINGKEKARFVGPEGLSECYGYILRHTSTSVHTALRYGGYSIEGAVDDKIPLWKKWNTGCKA